MPMRGRERRSNSSWKAIAQSRQRHRVGAHDHHAVSDVLHHARALGQRILDRDDEALEQVERLVLALLLGEADEPDQVGEHDRHPQDAERLLARLLQLRLHVRDHVLLDRVARKLRCR